MSFDKTDYHPPTAIARKHKESLIKVEGKYIMASVSDCWDNVVKP